MFKKSKFETLKRARFVDGIYFSRQKKKKNFRYLLLLLLIPIIVSFLFVGKLGANYLTPSLNFLSLFRDGKYLILFQNNSELRSSGGFIGSYAVVTVKDFEVKNISFNTNIYALDNAYASANHIDPPSAAMEKMLNGQTWALRDSNYDASFDEAALDIERLYQLETGDQVDGVIGINAKLIVELLKITGPIKLDKADVTITDENFYLETQNQIERIYYQNPENWVLNEPKSFLKDMYPILLSRALADKFQLYNLIKKELKSKEIIFYFNDPKKQTQVAENNLGGIVPAKPEINPNFLYINSNSYSGNKSSLAIKDEVTLNILETSDYGSSKYLANLKIKRDHTGSYDWPDGKNVDWLRVFVPNSAEFLSYKINDQDISKNIEIGADPNETYFGTEVTTEPGKENIIEINYLLPYEPDYHLLIQKQPGAGDKLVNVTLGDKNIYSGILDRDIRL